MQKLHWILLTLVLFSCCTPEQVESPLEEEVLANVIADIHIAEAALQSVSAYFKDSMSTVYYDQIFTIHNVTEEDFLLAMELMREDPKKLVDVYAKVTDILSEQEVGLKE